LFSISKGGIFHYGIKIFNTPNIINSIPGRNDNLLIVSLFDDSSPSLTLNNSNQTLKKAMTVVVNNGEKPINAAPTPAANASIDIRNPNSNASFPVMIPD
jgi:hypothetical protein